MQIPVYRRKKSGDWILQFINIVFLILVFFMIEGVIATPLLPGINPPLVLLSDAASPPQNGSTSRRFASTGKESARTRKRERRTRNA